MDNPLYETRSDKSKKHMLKSRRFSMAYCKLIKYFKATVKKSKDCFGCYKKSTISFPKLEDFVRNLTLFQIRVFSRDIKEATLTKNFIKVTVYPCFFMIKINLTNA